MNKYYYICQQLVTKEDVEVSPQIQDNFQPKPGLDLIHQLYDAQSVKKITSSQHFRIDTKMHTYRNEGEICNSFLNSLNNFITPSSKKCSRTCSYSAIKKNMKK